MRAAGGDCHAGAGVPEPEVAEARVAAEDRGFLLVAALRVVGLAGWAAWRPVGSG